MFFLGEKDRGHCLTYFKFSGSERILEDNKADITCHSVVKEMIFPEDLKMYQVSGLVFGFSNHCFLTEAKLMSSMSLSHVRL